MSIIGTSKSKVKNRFSGKHAAGFQENLFQLKFAIEKQLESSDFSVGFSGCDHGVGTTSLAMTFVDLLGKTSDVEPVFIDSNFRSPMIHLENGLKPQPGFRQFLEGSAGLEEIVQRPVDGTTHYITSGTGGASDCISRTPPSRIAKAMTDLRTKFKLTVFDLPPIGTYVDTALLSAHLDGLILVLESEKDRWEVAENAKQAIDLSGGRLIGAVLNKRIHHLPRWLYRLL